MTNKINSSYPKIRNEDIQRAEKILGVALPESIRKFYLEYNGGEPEREIYISDGYEYMLNYFMPLILPGSLYDTVIAAKKLVDDVAPSWFIPIADDGGELLYGFSIADGESGTIYCWNPEYDYGENPDDHVNYLCDSIQAFIEGMIKDADSRAI